MNPYRILSVGWMALCIFNGVMTFLFGFLNEWAWGENTLWSGCTVLIYVAGWMACRHLYRGGFWARVVVFGVAFFNAAAFSTILSDDKFLSRSLIFLVVINILYAWVSMIVLLVPKKCWGARILREDND